MLMNIIIMNPVIRCTGSRIRFLITVSYQGTVLKFQQVENISVQFSCALNVTK